MPAAQTYDELAARVAEVVGQPFVDKLMAGYEDVDFSARQTGAARTCTRCGALVVDQAHHVQWHRFITLGIRGMAFDLLAQALDPDDGVDAEDGAGG